MSDDQELSFDDLNLKFGQIIQIHPNLESNDERFDCLLVGCLPGESIIVSSPPATGEFPIIEVGQKVAMRVMSANGVALFPSTVLYISEIPIFMVYLDFPKAIKFRLIRNSSRVDVALPILAASLMEGGKRGVTGRISDISIGGAKVELDADIGEINTEMGIKGKFQVGEIRRVVDLVAIIRRKQRVAENKWSYGVQFNEADEEKLLILFGFIFNSMAFGRVQKIS